MSRDCKDKPGRLPMTSHIRFILDRICPNWQDDPEMEETPRRVAESYRELTRGYDPPDFKFTLFPTTSKGMVVRRDIPFSSLCAHHLLPYVGKVHIGILYNGSKLGISKLVRGVQYWSARLTSQEELTLYILKELTKVVKPAPKGVAVITEANHMCEALRGIKVPDVPTIIAEYSGPFMKDPKTRDEFLRLIGK